MARSGEWADELGEMDARRQAAREQGSAELLDKLRQRDRLTARERIAALLDEGSFREFGMLAGKGDYGAQGDFEGSTRSAHIIGLGRVDGRKIVAAAGDSSVRGGSSEVAVADKWIYAERYAWEFKLPIVRLVATAGGSVKLIEKMGHTKIPGYPSMPPAQMSGQVPIVGIAMGACAGLGAVRVCGSHFAIMVRGSSQVFAGGPPVVKRALGTTLSKDELGGADVHAASGVINNAVDSEREALQLARRFLSYLPQNVWQQPPRSACEDDPTRADAWLNDAIPHDRRKVFNVHKIVAALADAGSVLELSPRYGGSVVTVFARLNGAAVGMIANNPRVMGGAMTADAAAKMERFVDLCDTFHLPIVHLQDQPGLMVGEQAERAGTLSAATRLLLAIEQSTVPWIAIVLRRCFGLAGSMISPLHDGIGSALPHRFAWPSARWGSIPIEGGVAAAYKREIEAAADPEARREELERYYHKLESPFRTAERFGVVDVIEPASTRALLCDWVDDACAKTARNLGPKYRTMR